MLMGTNSELLMGKEAINDMSFVWKRGKYRVERSLEKRGEDHLLKVYERSRQ